MNKEELDLLEIVFTLAIGECAYNDINNIQKLEDKIKTINNLCKKQKEINQKAIEYIKSKENGKCIHNGIEKGAYTFVLDFDEAREFIWELLQILEDKEV